MCSGSSSPFTETSRRRSDKHSTGLFVRLAPAKARGTNTVLPQTTRTKNSLLEYTSPHLPYPHLFQSAFSSGECYRCSFRWGQKNNFLISIFLFIRIYLFILFYINRRYYRKKIQWHWGRKKTNYWRAILEIGESWELCTVTN